MAVSGQLHDPAALHTERGPQPVQTIGKEKHLLHLAFRTDQSGVRIPVQARYFWLLRVRTGSGTHAAAYSMSTGSSFPAGNAAGT